MTPTTMNLLKDLCNSQRWAWNVKELPKQGEANGPQRYGEATWGDEGEFFCEVSSSLPLSHVYFSQEDNAEVHEDIKNLNPEFPFNELIFRARIRGAAPADQPTHDDPNWKVVSPTEFQIESCSWLLYLLNKVFIPRGHFLEGILNATKNTEELFVSRNQPLDKSARSISSAFSHSLRKQLYVTSMDNPSLVELLMASLQHTETKLALNSNTLFPRFQRSVAFHQFEAYLQDAVSHSEFKNWKKNDALLREHVVRASTIQPSAYRVDYPSLFDEQHQKVGARLLQLFQEITQGPCNEPNVPQPASPPALPSHAPSATAPALASKKRSSASPSSPNKKTKRVVIDLIE